MLKDTHMTRRKTSELTIVSYRVVEEFSDDEHPSLPPAAIDVDGEVVSESVRPLAKCRQLTVPLKLVAGGKR